MVESRRPGDVLGLSIVACFGLGGWNVADGFEQAPVVEPVHPLQGGKLDVFQVAQWPAASDHLGLVEAVDRLGQEVVIGMADATDRRFDVGVGETLGVLDENILRPAIAVVDEAAALDGPAVVVCTDLPRVAPSDPSASSGGPPCNAPRQCLPAAISARPSEPRRLGSSHPRSAG